MRGKSHNSHGKNRGQGRGRSSNRGQGRPSRVHNQQHIIDVTEVDNHEDDYLYTVDTGKIKNNKPVFLVQLYKKTDEGRPDEQWVSRSYCRAP